MTPASVEDGTVASRVTIDRLVPIPTEGPAAQRNCGLADGVVVLVDGGHEVSQALHAKLNEEGLTTAPIDLSHDTSIRAAIADIGRSIGPIVAVVHLTALDGRAGPSVATSLLELAQAVGSELATAAETGGAAFISTTTMGGRFGIDHPPAIEVDPWHGLTAGFMKSLAQEWTSVRVKVIDFGPAAAHEVADRVVSELFTDDGRTEVGYDAGTRIVVELEPDPLPQRDPSNGHSELALDRTSVVLATGGARGITAATLVELARQYQPTLVVLGRSDPVDDADEPTSGITEPGALKRLIFEAGKASGSVSAKEVETTYQRIIRAREVVSNLDRMRAHGSSVEYLQVDVRDPDALSNAIEAIYARHGRIDGVVHGAGVVEDKLVVDKSPSSFDRVVDSKATAAFRLAELIRPETLRFLAFFSSVAGRFGSRGQSDYAGASEVLNKLAQKLNRQWAARVVSINWGPWEGGGMISPEVRRQFTRRGIGLIPLDTGSQAFVREIQTGAGPAEIVISAAHATSRLALLESASITHADDGSSHFARRLDPADDLYLNDHVIDDRPVLPFAVAMELMATAAATARPDLVVRALQNIRVHHGLIIDPDGADLRIVAKPSSAAKPDLASGARFSVTLSTQSERPDYSAMVELDQTDTGGADVDQDTRSVIVPRPLLMPESFPLSMAEAYEHWLFHGQLFQKITSIEAVSERGLTAVVTGSDPATCLRTVDDGAHWILDPVLIDAALQAQVLWARHHWDITLLPAQIDEVRLISTARPPGESLRLELRIRPSSRRPFCRADHWFFASDGTLLATMSGVEGVGTPALNRLAVR